MGQTTVKGIVLLLSMLLLAGVAWAQDSATESPDTKAAADEELTVAVLSFESRLPDAPNLAVELSDMVAAVLSANDRVRLVDRESLNRTLEEQQLTLTGLVSAENGIEVGKLVGAKIIVSGRIFKIGQKTMLTAKLVGTETSRVKVLMARGDGKQGVDELVLDLADKIDAGLVKSGDKLVGSNVIKKDPLPEILKKLAEQKTSPVVAVLITEEHIPGPRPLADPVDPAVETEIKRLLTLAGITVKDVPENELADWAKNYTADGNAAWPRSLNGVDLVVTGEAFSEYANEVGRIISCSARAEINVISRKDGTIVVADRATTRGVDLAENIAAKTALQKAGHTMGVRLLEYLAK